MEIRLLVNGNLVHTAFMPELQMITSKRDIFFVTTAPEFMSKDLNIKGLQINELSSEKRLVTTPSETSSNEELSRENSNNGSSSSVTAAAAKEQPLNPEYELTNLLEIPNISAGGLGPGAPIQRARSLQKSPNTMEQKPSIAKSNSCGDSYNAGHGASRHNSLIEQNNLMQPGVPPNSPRNNGVANNNKHSPNSPTKRNSKYRNIFNTNGPSNINSNNDGGAYSSSPDRLKPLRIYRIPLAKLTGAHSHFHMHAFSAPPLTSSALHLQHRGSVGSPLAMQKKQHSVDMLVPSTVPE